MSAHPQALRAEIVDERVRVYFDEKNASGRDELVKAASEDVVFKGLRVRSPDLMGVLRVIRGSSLRSSRCRTPFGSHA